MRVFVIWMFVSLLLLAACDAPQQPNVTVQPGVILAQDGFNSTAAWDQQVQGGVRIGVEGGVYRMQADVNQYVRGFGTEAYEDIIIELDLAQLSAADNNGYGLMCRASFDRSSANGYYFLISGDGMFSIREGRQGEVQPLIKWQSTSAINRGAGVNRLRVVCVEDYLSLSINGELVGQVRDNSYSRGLIGMVATTESGTQIDVTFDNLLVRAASLVP